MSRCKSCDAILTTNEMSRTKDDGTPEDLCGGCGYLVFLDVEDMFVAHEYAQAHITESYYYGELGVNRMLNSGVEE